MSDEEIEVLRTKLLLLDTTVIRVGRVPNSDGTSRPTWAVIKAGRHHFRFKDDQHRIFYHTELEAMQEALRLLQEGTELTVWM